MEQLKLNEVKEIQLNILKAVDCFCRENGIRYWLDYGTLIGAVRHKGFIPWDDDIDIGMLRKDYEVFIKIFNKSSKRYRFVCIENEPLCWHLFGKVMDTETVLWESPWMGIPRFCVNIDIFPYDNVPDSNWQLKDMWLKVRGLQLLDAYNRADRIYPGCSWMKKIWKNTSAWHIVRVSRGIFF